MIIVLLSAGIMSIIIAVAVTTWAGLARMVRGEVLTIRDRDYVTLARIAGLSPVAIIWRHVFPNVINTLMVMTSLLVGQVILLEASLSYLGLGLAPGEPAWGIMVAEGRQVIVASWWIAVFPGIAITVVVMALTTSGTGCETFSTRSCAASKDLAASSFAKPVSRMCTQSTAVRLPRLRLFTSLLCLLSLLFAGCTFAVFEQDTGVGQVAPFTNIAPQALGDNAFVINRYPGVAIFDYDRDNDQDFYVTQAEGGPNSCSATRATALSEKWAGTQESLRTTATARASWHATSTMTAIRMYMSARAADTGDALDFRSADAHAGLREAITDRLFLNNGDGTFKEITGSAFGLSINLRSAASIACARR